MTTVFLHHPHIIPLLFSLCIFKFIPSFNSSFFFHSLPLFFIWINIVASDMNIYSWWKRKQIFLFLFLYVQFSYYSLLHIDLPPCKYLTHFVFLPTQFLFLLYFLSFFFYFLLPLEYFQLLFIIFNSTLYSFSTSFSLSHFPFVFHFLFFSFSHLISISPNLTLKYFRSILIYHHIFIVLVHLMLFLSHCLSLSFSLTLSFYLSLFYINNDED